MQPTVNRASHVRTGGVIAAINAVSSNPGDLAPYLGSINGVAETLEHLAVARLRQFVYDRRLLRQGRLSSKNTNLGRPNSASGSSRYDARSVRCIDFERAFSTLRPEFQQLLWLRFGDGQDWPTTAACTGISQRAAQYKLADARKALTLILDRLDLL